VESSDEESPLSYAARRLQRSVIRPINEALQRASDEHAAPKPQVPHAGRGDVGPEGKPVDDSGALLAGEPLWKLAQDATRLRLMAGVQTEVQEAAAALQDLACQFAPADSNGPTHRLTDLREIQAHLPRGIQSQANGPYLVTNAENFTNWLGESLPTRPQMALCRCGQSAIKPFCDGTHAEIGFTAEKDKKRVTDQRDTYVGQQVTILDNRGTCQHSGYCTDRLATVFRLDTDPFVAPSGARIVGDARKASALWRHTVPYCCPSGSTLYGNSPPPRRASRSPTSANSS